MTPSVSNALTQGISLTWKNFGRFVVPSLILFFSIAIYTGVSVVASIVMEYAPLVGFMLQMFSLLLQGVFIFVSAALFVWIAVRALQVIRSSDEPRYTWSRFGWYLLYQLVLGAVAALVSIPIVIVSFIAGFTGYALGGLSGVVIAIVGLIVLAMVLALIYLSIRVMLAPYAIADTNANPIEALKRSWHLSAGRFWPLFGLSIFTGILNLIGMFALGIGMIFTIPASYVVLAHYYEQLVGVEA